MELFYAEQIEGTILTLGTEESAHCAKVLRHREGDIIRIADGRGNLHSARIVSLSPKQVSAVSESVASAWGDHPYRLTMAVCPTKNMDRYEWFIEKAVEMGVDCIVPLIGEHSERLTIRPDRLRRIILSAAKQSLKARLPELCEPLSVKDFIAGGQPCPEAASSPDAKAHKFIACCFDPRISLKQALDSNVCFPAASAPYCDQSNSTAEARPILPDSQGILPCGQDKPMITILIGPEGDFSPSEVSQAIAAGYLPVHLGPSRLRTETAAVVATSFVYNASL